MGYGRDAGCMMKNDDACMAFHHVALTWRLDRDDSRAAGVLGLTMSPPGLGRECDTRHARERGGVVFVEATRTRTSDRNPDTRCTV